MKLERLRTGLHLLRPYTLSTPGVQARFLHRTRPPHEVPQPRPFVPDVPTFLTLIGRGLSRYAKKFPTWESLWTVTGPQLKELGVEPPRTRKYLLAWMQRYRQGNLGPGGDFRFVQDGQAILKTATPPAGVVSDTKFVVNVPHPEAEASADTEPSTLIRPQGYVVRGAKSISGPFATPLPNATGAVVKVTEGMWEHRRGRKIDGGERRRAEVRFKKRSAERRAQREAEILASLSM
jgi:hypothetical protein